jgi:hypothetical protein
MQQKTFPHHARQGVPDPGQLVQEVYWSVARVLPPPPEGADGTGLVTDSTVSNRGLANAPQESFPSCKTGRTNLEAGREVYWSLARVLPPHPKYVFDL